MIDKREKLKENRFSYRVIKNDKVFIYFDNKEIMTLKALEAQELVRTLEGANDYEIQYYLAIVTGQFKHGNERISKKREKAKMNMKNARN